MKSLWTQFFIEFKLHMREPEAIFWGFVFPVVMIVALGFLFSKKPQEPTTITVAINKEFLLTERYQLVKKSIDSFSRIKLVPFNINEIETAFKEEKFKYALNIQTEKDNIFQVKVLYSSIAETTFEKDEGVFDQFLNHLNQGFLELNAINLPFKKQVEKIYIKGDSGKNISYVDWLLTGVIGLNLFISCAFGLGISVVQDKRNGKFKKIATTPLPIWKFMLSISIQRMVILYLQAITILIAGFLIFSIKPVGSLIDYFVVLTISIFTFMIFGFAIASISNTTEKAVAIANVLFVASMLMSGAYFPNTGLPSYLKILADLTPVTLCVDATRGIYTYGKPLTEYWFQIIGLFIWIGIGFLFNLKFFKWTNE